MRIATALLLVGALLALPACQMNERMSGTAFGGVGGAALGALVAETFAGALIGGVAGGVVGYLIGDYLADQRERCNPCAPNPCDPCAPAPCAPAPCAPPQYAPQPCAPQYAPQYSPQPCPPQPCAPATYYPPPRVGAVKTRDTSRETSNAWVARGREARTLPEAIRAYEQAVRVDPRNADGWNALGLARQAGSERAAARAAFERALQVDPNHWAAQQNLRWVSTGI